METKQIKDLLNTSFGAKVISSKFRYRNDAYLQGFILDRPYYVRGKNDKKLIMTIPLICVKEHEGSLSSEMWNIDTNDRKIMRIICSIDSAMFVNLTCKIKFNDENKIKLTLDKMVVIKTFPQIKLVGLPLNNELKKRLGLERKENGTSTKERKSEQRDIKQDKE